MEVQERHPADTEWWLAYLGEMAVPTHATTSIQTSKLDHYRITYRRSTSSGNSFVYHLACMFVPEANSSNSDVSYCFWFLPHQGLTAAQHITIGPRGQFCLLGRNMCFKPFIKVMLLKDGMLGTPWNYNCLDFNWILHRPIKFYYPYRVPSFHDVFTSIALESELQTMKAEQFPLQFPSFMKFPYQNHMSPCQACTELYTFAKPSHAKVKAAASFSTWLSLAMHLMTVWPLVNPLPCKK